MPEIAIVTEPAAENVITTETETETERDDIQWLDEKLTSAESKQLETMAKIESCLTRLQTLEQLLQKNQTMMQERIISLLETQQKTIVDQGAILAGMAVTTLTPAPLAEPEPEIVEPVAVEAVPKALETEQPKREPKRRRI